MNIIVILVLMVFAGFIYNMYKNMRQMNNQKAVKKPEITEGNYSYPPDVISLYEKGYNFETGYGTAQVQDLEKAIEFYTYAAQADYPVAQYRLASIYYKGKTIGTQHIDQNLAKARFWIVKAVARDYPNATELYKQIDTLDKLQQQQQTLDRRD